MLKSTIFFYNGVASIDNWKGKMMWRTLEKCWRCQGFHGDGEEGKSKVSPRNHYEGRHWNYTKEEWNKRTQGGGVIVQVYMIWICLNFLKNNLM